MPTPTTGGALAMYPYALTTDAGGNVYVGGAPSSLYKVTPAGSATRVAGNGLFGVGSDGLLGSATPFAQVTGAVVDSAGNVYVSDEWMHRVRRVDAATGIVTTIAGGNGGGYSGDGGPALNAQFNDVRALALDAARNKLYVVDTQNARIRMVDFATGRISTVASTGTVAGIVVDAAGSVYFTENDTNRIRKITGGVVTTFAGNGVDGFSADGVVAGPSMMISHPSGIAIDPSGSVNVIESNRVRRINAASQQLETVAGNGNWGMGGEGGPATSAMFTGPQTLAIDSAGNVFIGDENNLRVRRVAASTGLISTVVGPGVTGDGGPGTAASLVDPLHPAVDALGNAYVPDRLGQRLRRIAAGTGTITTVAGRGES